VQTGTHKGADTSFIATGLAENSRHYPMQKGRLITIDVGDYGAQKLWRRLELDNITQIIGDSRLKETWDGLHIPHDSIGWLHCDGDHAGETLVTEFNHALPYLDKKTCFISSHDTRLDARLAPGVRQVLDQCDEMRVGGEGWIHIAHLAMRNLRGLDFIQLSNEDI
jgi:hypothetical protein